MIDFVSPSAIEDLEKAFKTCVAEGYTAFISFYGNKVHATLTKRGNNAGGLQMEVRSEGDSVSEALTGCFANFPINPLDGATRWKDNRLTAPVEEGVFTETKQ